MSKFRSYLQVGMREGGNLNGDTYVLQVTIEKVTNNGNWANVL